MELSNLTVSNNGLLDPVFNSATKVYDLNLPISGNAVSVVPTVASGCGVETTVDVNGIPGNSGDTFGPTDMSLFNTVATITITVTSQWDSGINNVYTLSATRGVTTQEAYIKKDTAPDYSEHFGSATAMSGNTLVVGMPGANGDIGAAYVYTRDTTGTWSLQQVLSLVGIGTAGDNFGSSVAIENNTIVVGAIGAEGNIVAGSGAAYVFTRSGTLWNGPYPLTQDSSVSTGDNFGCSVAISSGTIAVGSCNQTDSGAVYVFVGSGSSWHQQAMLQAAHRASKDEFGYSVSITGDRIAVGVPQESSNSVGINHNPSSWTNALLSGAVYVFERSGSVWTVSAYIKASNAMAGNQFGSSVKVAGSYLVVGAPYENSNGIGIGGDQSQPLTITPETKALYNISSGAVYVFKYISNTWTQGTDGYVKASNPSAYAYFGSSLDGGVSNTSVLVVGAPGESSDLTGIQYGAYTISNTAASGSGAAYVFIKNETLNTDRAQLAYIKASNTDAGDSFGSAVACNGDVVVVGAPYEDSNATGINCSGVNCELDNSIDDSGAVYTFY